MPRRPTVNPPMRPTDPALNQTLGIVDARVDESTARHPSHDLATRSLTNAMLPVESKDLAGCPVLAGSFRGFSGCLGQPMG